MMGGGLTLIRQVAYYPNFNKWVKVNPTGRWKLNTSPHYKGYSMFVEHIYPDGTKTWMPEEHISFLNERTEVVFGC